MTLVPTADLVAAAVARGGAVAAVNVITLEHAEAICAAATVRGTPVILQISENAVRYHGNQLLPIAAATAAAGRLAAVPVALHLDHVTDDDLLAQAADAGFSSLMYDAGALPYRENVARTERVARIAHAAGLWVEAELGYVGGKPDAPASAHLAGVRTDPNEAADYIRRTGVDGLAVAVGSSHAMTGRTAILDLELIGRLRDRLPTPLVLHGSSGVPDDQLRAAARAGIRKVNVGTALNAAMTGSVRLTLGGDEKLVDPRKYLTPAREAMCDTVDRLLAVLP
ncbi:class II fructose-bisphosphate aldolase [Amycolatopsis taiwanensis]|uniref:Fructose-bisphosphate aldolase n=1 Tax=Amycolatopsis taiwanensis TaxID=342230 RepID=A0A9W6RA45_9PSEU|nr:class II fructose-bisphosphate aldolase [Amycolatopsis taiwanensis]GLY70332.1 fructose-bisphosphate aldolase [Amycolatopsis taiwanensis]